MTKTINKKAFSSNANFPLSDSLNFKVNTFECVWGGGCRAMYREVQVEQVWTCLGKGDWDQGLVQGQGAGLRPSAEGGQGPV